MFSPTPGIHSVPECTPIAHAVVNRKLLAQPQGWVVLKCWANSAYVFDFLGNSKKLSFHSLSLMIWSFPSCREFILTNSSFITTARESQVKVQSAVAINHHARQNVLLRALTRWGPSQRKHLSASRALHRGFEEELNSLAKWDISISVVAEESSNAES